MSIISLSRHLLPNPISSKFQGIGMFSEDGEYLDFLKPVNMEGPVEIWLCEIETSMRACLKNEFKPCRAALKKMLNKRDKWLMENCGQLCNACSQIQWTTSCTRALMHCKIMESKKPMKRLRKKQNQVLDKLSEMSRKDLNRLSRLKVNALITIEIHCRDVIDKMYKANCMDVGAFEWFSQLKFYWDREIDDCVIKQTNTSFRYGYEYNGNSGRLVITPLTDRCYITLTTALHLYRGGSPQGPAGTGKTETVKDLGKAMGMWVIVNNCSEGLDYKSMGKCFSGLAQTGAWGCFDEFNRINIEVLSVVAQQILCILLAISQRLKTFVFEGIEINLQPTCGIFITMNPGYAGRTELPDNLKSMFRPIAMCVPDSMIIAENTLFSDGFQTTKLLAKKPVQIAITKVIQLYETKNSRHSVMILGNTGTAKTVTWKSLKGAMGRLKKLNKAGFNVVEVFPINPKALNLGELYGEYNLATNEWLDGVISATMRTTCSDTSPNEKWILFDGPVDAVWIENMNSVMDDNKVLTLINSDRITMPQQVSLLFEVGDLSVASPATVSRCGMVYNDYKDWGWTPFVTSWIQKHSRKGKLFQETVNRFFVDLMGTTLEFRRLNCQSIMNFSELNLVDTLCKLLDIFLTPENGVDPNNEESFEDIAKLWFLFCLVWSVCCTVDEEGRRKLDNFLREKEGVFPIKDTVYEYYVDVKNKAYAAWEDKLSATWKFEPSIAFYKIVVPTVDTVRYKYVVNTLLSHGHPCMLTGPVGGGKTSVAQSVLAGIDNNIYSVLNINMSAQTTSLNVQETIESRVEKRTKGVFFPVGGKKMIIFLDDFNMPAKETYGSQPPLELLRQWIDYSFWYDRLKQTRKYIMNCFLLAAMGPPGGGRQMISERMLSKFCSIYMTFPSEAQIARIYGTMLSQHLQPFHIEVKALGKEITETTIELYNNVVAKMLPTPAKMHYLFNLRDISRVYQGLLRAHNEYTNTKPGILRLWVHESVRVFYDRLIDDKDRDWFLNHIHEQLGKHFEITLHSICPNWTIPTFGDFVNPWRIYEDLQDPNIVRKFIEGQMEQYNVSPGVVRMDLVLFADAIDHICRITRVISQPRGNVMLVGIGGGGRQSLSRIANYICEYNTFELTVSKSYRIPEFKEDLKTLYSATGGDNKQTGFLFNDTQVMDEGFLEIINNMLSTGEVANLYKSDEFEEIKNRIGNAAAKAGVPYTTEALYTFFIERVRLNMHVILCMSPVGEAFRNRLRMYPALISCTTIDWFCDWPKEALIEVANKYIDGVDFVATITGEKLVSFPNIYMKLIDSSDVSEEQEERFHQDIKEMEKRYQERMLAEKREEIASQANKLRNGLWKIEDCRQKVELMSVELEEAQAKVEEFKVQCDEMIVIIAAQRREADEQQKEVTIKSIRIGEEEIQCKKLADLAQADLDEAMPALDEAVRALDALNKKDISEMKSYTKPPEKVKLVMEAVMILKQVDTSWEEAKRQLGDQYFLQGLREFDKNNISDKTMKKIHQYTTNPEFVPDKVGIVSVAAKSLCMWVIAIEKYAKVWRVVRPKKEKLDEALESLKEKQRLLAEAQAKLAELNMMLQKLQREYEEKLLQKEELDRKAEMLRLKLERAAMLVENLSGEKERWEQTVIDLKGKFNNLPGDCLLGIAFISYMGPFVTKYRDDMVDRWKKEVEEQEIPFSSDFNVVNFLCDPTTVREWNIQGLPSDAFSTENGIIVVRGSRWPLVIDPQTQAQKWIKNMEGKNDLQVIDLSTPRFMGVLEKAIQFGKPVLLQNILEEMDPSLNPILNKAIVKQGGMDLIKLDDKMVSYNHKFRLFITTKLTNPHYPPEISTKTSLINFAIKQQGLEAQLLGIVVRKEKPQLEIQKDEMVLTIARGKRALIDLENELLRLLNETRGSLLEDAELFNTLQVSKATAVAVVESLAISEETEIAIDLAREGYRPCAERASILFFVQNDMGKIDPMYQFSLDAYTLLFTQSIERSSKSSNLNDRINFLNDYHTYSVYKNTCRALFERHKLLFSFHMCVKILEALKKIVPAEYNFLLKGGVVLDRENQIDNPCSVWLSETAWDNITELDKIAGFHGVVNTFEQFPRDWHAWYIHSEPETLPLIGEWDDQCNEFQKMLFVRSLRSDRLSFSVSNFIINNLDPKFVEPPVLDIRSVLEESLPQTPLIFVLSSGVDPTNSLIQLAEAFDMTPYFFSLSLGQGQAPIATRLIQIGLKEGHWVFLANCHLSLSWMPKLDKIVETIQYGKIHPDFRLWLSSSPHPDFPISILQAAIKMTTEPPKLSHDGMKEDSLGSPLRQTDWSQEATDAVPEGQRETAQRTGRSDAQPPNPACGLVPSATSSPTPIGGAVIEARLLWAPRRPSTAFLARPSYASRIYSAFAIQCAAPLKGQAAHPIHIMPPAFHYASRRNPLNGSGHLLRLRHGVGKASTQRTSDFSAPVEVPMRLPLLVLVAAPREPHFRLGRHYGRERRPPCYPTSSVLGLRRVRPPAAAYLPLGASAALYGTPDGCFRTFARVRRLLPTITLLPDARVSFCFATTLFVSNVCYAFLKFTPFLLPLTFTDIRLLKVSEKLLSIYLDEYNQTTPWDALKYLIADINYGGHVSDDWDRRLLTTYINQYFCEDALNVPFYRLSSLPTYYIPKDGSLQSYLNYIILLPTTDRPEAFGQNSNADITSLISETRMMCETLMSLQISGAAGSEGSTEEKVAQMAADILSKVPSPINYEDTEKLMGYNKTPLDVVLLQEISRYNILLNGMIKSLDELQKGIKGLVVMSMELEEIFICIDEGRVPSSWMKAYPSLKLLGSWTRDLVARVEHFAKWAETTHPPLLFWLAAYTFPTGFLTAVLQTAARAMEVPIDILGWEFTVLTVEENVIVEPPDAGVYCRGTFLEGAGWDKKNACLIDPAPMKLVYPMPVILFKPAEILKKKTRGLYVCPCYYYPVRCGVQGYPAFVVAVDLKSGMEASDFWVKRATALLLSLPT
ncbi:dynein heavy chain 2, axonemal-like [Agrilus planipennis]|uniref:Dynein heavy chain 2, axonemal-like n=1 Tax=Agrilus planipennis TaxID=224129 RepID=A0A7F5RJF5_AGRPL|nr:dynein heavy chain 2, axonemal-like [Agrilus planipennis]